MPAALAVIALALFLAVHGGDDEPVASGERSHAVVWAVGDADGSAEARSVADLIESDQPDRVIYLGDIYGSGTPAQVDAGFALVYRDLLDRVEPTPGNHEWPRHEAVYDPFWAEVKGRPQPLMYSFRVGGWEVISLNSEGFSGPDDPELAWLESRLDAGGECRIAYWHRPRYSAGPHGDETGFQPFWDTLEGRARLILNGHDHGYQRFEPVQGLTEIVAGAGGHELYPVDEEREGLVASDDEEYGALRLELSSGRADYEYVTVDGDVIDSGTITCDEPAGG
ncbi:MAG TPA: metallophosphoesterase [Solirubrobacterales bacterium]|nr:metallophosphoesterase [Solirubrobacterales bacterium]